MGNPDAGNINETEPAALTNENGDKWIAKEKRTLYVDVDNLPKEKAEEYVKELMTKFKARLVDPAEFDTEVGHPLPDAAVRYSISIGEDVLLNKEEAEKILSELDPKYGAKLVAWGSDIHIDSDPPKAA